MSDEQHHEALLATGRWGAQGAGCIVFAKDTGRVLLPLRSSEVLEPGTWGTFGGAMDGTESPDESALRELIEETLCDPLAVVEMIPSHLYEQQDNGFRYHNFIAVVETEFDPILNWESADAQWFEVGQWPTPLHFGLKAFLNSEQASTQLAEIAGISAPARVPLSSIFESFKELLAQVGEETTSLPTDIKRGPTLK